MEHSKNIKELIELLEEMKEYFNKTPRDIIEREWHEYDKYNNVGPTVNKFLENNCKYTQRD